MTPKKIGFINNDSVTSYRSGRAYKEGIADMNVSGNYYDFGFPTSNIYIENIGTVPIYLSFKSAGEDITILPLEKHAKISASSSRIFRQRIERGVNLFTESASAEFLLEAW